MPRPTLLAALAGASLIPIPPVFAHGFAGPHMFVSTLIIDDPNVADEASQPTWSYQPQPSDGGLVSNLFAAEFEFDKRITENFGFAINGSYQWLSGVPLRGGEKAMTVNWLMIEISDASGKLTYRNSFITDLEVGRDNVAELAARGRARWKIENESFNVLKTKGYNLGHNFGHGKQHLATVLAILNLLAFACHTVCELGDRAWRAARRELVTRQGFFQSLRTITTYLLFQSWDDLLGTLAFARLPPLGP